MYLDQNDWIEISKFIPGRNYMQCKLKFKQHKKSGSRKIIWTAEEDKTLKQLVLENGNRNWSKIA